MKYYSDLTKKVYNTQEELEKAEDELALAQKEKEEKLSLRKEEANKVMEAYNNCVAIRKECDKQINDADQKFLELRNAFIKKYGSWHMSFSDSSDNYGISGTLNSWRILLKNFFID